MMPEPLVEARRVTKVFPGTVALDAVDFAVRPGQVHALAGGNGAGKSTLVKILAGIEQPTSGGLWREGRPVRFANAREAARLGIGVIHQELNLCGNLTVADNIFLGRESGMLLDRRAEERRAGEWLSRLAPGIDPRARLGDLPLGRQQVVEIAKALARDARVLMMDEPTSALSGAEIDALFGVIRGLAARGVGIVYISHRLPEVLKIADSITVLRDGSVVGREAVASVDLPWIVERMTGRQWDRSPAAAPRRAEGRPRLEVRGLRVAGQLRQVSFQVGTGELLGIYGLLGAGQSELLEALLGVRPGAEGEVLLNGRRLDRLRPDQRIAAGLALVPEDRQAAGLVQTMSVRENLTLAALGRFTGGLPLLSAAREKSAAGRLVSELRIRVAGLDRPITSLSGGNQQKVVIGRFLENEPKVLLMNEPTRGIDVGARAEIYGLMRRLVGEGMAIVFASSEIDEIRELADRVLVLSRGRLAGEFAAAEASQERLLEAATRAEGDIAC
jgi:erythritol transport system ATP-binding protein